MTTDSRDADVPFAAPLDATEKRSGVRYGVLGFLCTLALLLYIDRVCIGQAAESIQKEMELTSFEFSFVLNAFTLAYCLFEVPTGHLGDRYGSRGVITRIVVWWSAFTALTGATFGLWSLVAVRFLFGVGEAGAFPNAALVVTKWFPTHERGRVRGLITMVSLLGGASAPIVAEHLIHRVGWRWTFAVFGSLGVVWSAAFYWWFRDRPADHPACNDAERRLIDPTGGQTPAPAVYEHHPIPWGIVLTSPNMWLLGTIMMVSASLFYMQYQWFPNYLKEARGQTLGSGWLSSTIMVGGAIGCTLGGLLVDAIQKRTSERVWTRRLCGCGGLLLSAVSMLAVRHAESATVAALCNACALMFLQISIPTWWTVVAEISGRHGAAMWGLMNSMGGVGVMSTTFLTGWFITMRKTQGYSNIECWTPVFDAMGGLLVLGAVLWLFINPKRSIVERREEGWAPQPASVEA